MSWHDYDKQALDNIASNKIVSGLSDGELWTIMAARAMMHLAEVSEQINYLNSTLSGLNTTVMNQPTAVTTPYVPPSVDAQDVQNLTKAITQLNETIFELSPEQRGLVYRVKEPLEVPE